jgi:hypothetical protein
MAKWNFWAATMTGVSALLQIWKFLPDRHIVRNIVKMSMAI